MDDERDELRPGTPEPSAGSAEPGPDESSAPPRFDDELLEQAGTLPRADALGAGDPGAPVHSLGTGGGDGPGAGARHQGGTGGAGAVVGDLRDRGSDIASDDEEPAAGGPSAGRPGRD